MLVVFTASSSVSLEIALHCSSIIYLFALINFLYSSGVLTLSILFKTSFNCLKYFFTSEEQFLFKFLSKTSLAKLSATAPSLPIGYLFLKYPTAPPPTAPSVIIPRVEGPELFRTG